jgi:hypothetical protein
MFEATTQPEIRNAIDAAHNARGAAFRSILSALFGHGHKKGPCPEGQGPDLQGCGA